MRPRLCSHPGAISRWFLYTRADKHGSGGDSCPGCGVWLVTSNILSSVWALCPKSLCLLVLRVKALHINLRKSTKDPCFFNYKIHTFFFCLSMYLKLRCVLPMMTTYSFHQPGSRYHCVCLVWTWLSFLVVQLETNSPGCFRTQTS